MPAPRGELRKCLAESLISAPRAQFMVTSLWLPVVFYILTTPLQASMAAVIYHELRRSKEGIEIDQLAAVFE